MFPFRVSQKHVRVMRTTLGFDSVALAYSAALKMQVAPSQDLDEGRQPKGQLLLLLHIFKAAST